MFLPAATLVTADFEEVYVRPSDNATCPGHPCFLFSEYTTEVNEYFKDNTTFLFMDGIHILNASLHIENVSEVAKIKRSWEQFKFRANISRSFCEYSVD